MLVERKCAWCGKHLGEKEVSQIPQYRPAITHSICPSCSAKLARDIEDIETKNSNDEPKTNYQEKEIVK